MGSRGEAEDADGMRINVPFGGVGENETDGALRILKSRGRFWIGAGVGDAIFEDDAGDAAAGQPVADFGAFEIDGEDVVGGGGEDYDRGAGGICCGFVQSDSGIGDIAETDERFAGDEVVFGSGGIRFGWGILRGSGCAFGPDGDLSLAGGGLPSGRCLSVCDASGQCYSEDRESKRRKKFIRHRTSSICAAKMLTRECEVALSGGRG